MGKKRFGVYCSMIMLILVLHLAGTLLQGVLGDSFLKEGELNGVSTVPETPQLSWGTLLSGGFPGGCRGIFHVSSLFPKDSDPVL